MIFSEIEIDVEIFTLLPDTRDEDEYGHELITSTKLHSLGVAKNCVLESRAFNIQNDQISTTNITGRYLRPVGVM